MKKTILPLVFVSLMFGLWLTSCVPTKKLTESEAKVNQLESDSVKTHNLLNDCNAQVKELNQDKSTLENQNQVGKNNLQTLADESNLTIKDQATRLQRLEDIIQNQRNIMTNLKNSISEALINYEADELSVYQKNGNVYVSL
ncbi:MAG: hypothetical protein Q8O72_16420 [Bacteroidales bacterium]|nr:hypothetical protein [Bacteroidales bacterium]